LELRDPVSEAPRTRPGTWSPAADAGAVRRRNEGWRVADKDIEHLVRALGRAGWPVDQTGKNYYLVYRPDGTFLLRIPSTPSSPRTIRRIRGKLRQHGFEE
jgi:hypothetical protein